MIKIDLSNNINRYMLLGARKSATITVCKITINSIEAIQTD